MHIFQRGSAKVFSGNGGHSPRKEKWPNPRSQTTRFSPGVPSLQLRQPTANCLIMPANMDVVSKPSAAAMPICRERITAVHRQDNPPACVLANHTRLLLSRFLAAHLAVGDEIIFPVPAANGNRAAGTESSSQSLLHRGVIATVIRRRSVTLPYPEEASGINFSCLRRFVIRASA